MYSDMGYEMLDEDNMEDLHRQNTILTSHKVRRNLATLLQGSMITPFKWLGNNYRCFFCNMTFLKTQDLKVHTGMEHEGFYTNTILKYAITDKHLIKLDLTDMSCRFCSISFERLDQLVDHLVEVHDLKYTAGLQEHFMLFKLTDDDLQCIHCGEQFDFFGHLLRHMLKEHNSGDYMCDVCGRSFLFPQRLKQHCEEHEGDMKYECEICGKLFKNLTNKKCHEGTAHGAYNFSCDCGETFKSAYKLKQHKVKDHDTRAAYKCDDCDKSFCWKNHLIKHRNNVHLNIRVSCPVCGKEFHNKYLNTHMISHRDEKPYECHICKKAFARTKTLKVHMKSHFCK